MAQTLTSNFAGLLTEAFSRDKVFAPFERAMCKFYDSIQEFPNEEPLGKGRTFGIRTKDAHAVGAGLESTAVVPTFRQPEVLQANIDAVQVIGTCSWSELMMSAGRGLGSLGPDVITDHVDMTMRNFMSCLNRLSLGHGTGRLAAVEANTSSSTTTVMRNPEGVLQLRVNMLIDYFDTDTTGGTKQGQSETISAIDFETRTITHSSRSLTANWGVYQALTSSVSTASVTPDTGIYGLRATADDGELTTKIYGLTRSSNPGVNATVLDVASGTQAYSEKLMRKAVNRVLFQCGLEPDEAWTNKGIISEHLNHLVGDRTFMLGPGDNVPKYRIGQKDNELGFQNGGTFIPFKVDLDLPAREIVFIKRSMFRRHVLRKPNWIGDDSGIDGSAKAIMLQLPASGGSYELAKIAIMLGMMNIGNKMPKSTVRVSTLFDEELAGDA